MIVNLSKKKTKKMWKDQKEVTSRLMVALNTKDPYLSLWAMVSYKIKQNDENKIDKTSNQLLHGINET